MGGEVRTYRHARKGTIRGVILSAAMRAARARHCGPEVAAHHAAPSSLSRPFGHRTHALTAEGHDASEDGTGRGTPIIAAETEVRRLTPLECERLQGHPDGWTDVDGMSDSQRYKQMGNGVAVPVFEWVARRLVAVDARIREVAA